MPAFVVFFTITGILNERIVVGMEWADVVVSPMIGLPQMILTARLYKVWRS